MRRMMSPGIALLLGEQRRVGRRAGEDAPGGDLLHLGDGSGVDEEPHGALERLTRLAADPLRAALVVRARTARQLLGASPRSTSRTARKSAAAATSWTRRMRRAGVRRPRRSAASVAGQPRSARRAAGDRADEVLARDREQHRPPERRERGRARAAPRPSGRRLGEVRARDRRSAARRRRRARARARMRSRRNATTSATTSPS